MHLIVAFFLAAMAATVLAQPTPPPPMTISGVSFPQHPFATPPRSAIDSLYEPYCPLGEQGLTMVIFGQSFYLVCPSDPRPRWLGWVQTSGSIAAVADLFGHLFLSTYAGELAEVGRTDDGRFKLARRWPTAVGLGLLAFNGQFFMLSDLGLFKYRLGEDGGLTTPSLPALAPTPGTLPTRGCVQVSDPGPGYLYALCVDRPGGLRSVDKGSGVIGEVVYQHAQLRSVVTGGTIYGMLGEAREYIYPPMTVSPNQPVSFGPGVSRRIASGSIVRIDFGANGKPTATKVNRGGDIAPVGAAFVFGGKLIFANEHWDGGQFIGYSVKSLDPKTGTVTDFISLEALRGTFGEYVFPGPFFTAPSQLPTPQTRGSSSAPSRP